MSNVMILGYKGFLGSCLKEYHLQKGDFVYGIASRYNQDDDCKNFRAINYDLFNAVGDILSITKKVDYIYNFAWSSSSLENRSDFEKQYKNLRMSCNSIDLAKKIGCKRVLFASSICEMEVIEDLFLNDDLYLHENQLYGITKLSSRLYSQALAYKENIEFIPLIISNVFGVGEISNRLINSTIRKIIKNEHISFSEGTQMYDFIYIDDAIKKISLIAEKGKDKNQYYIGSENPKPLKDYLLELINKINKNADYCFGEIKSSSKGVDYSRFDLCKVSRELGYKNESSFSEGVIKTYRWLNSKMLEEGE